MPKTYRLADGKYEIDRDAKGAMTDMRRKGTHWEEGFRDFQFANSVHAMLNLIDERDARIAQLESELEKALVVQPKQSVFTKRYR